jgi:rare lipoprotein A
MRNYLMFGFFFLSLIFATNVTADVEEYGTASYYSDKFQGRKTASGELYDKNKLTGAHKSLKFGTIILVTRLDNKKSVKIRINDRGPYIKGRIVDVSRAAAEKLDLVRDGHAEVKIEIVGEAQSEDLSSSPAPSPNNQPNLSDLKKVVDEPVPTEFSDKSVGLPKTPAIVSTINEVNEKPAKKSVPDLKVPAKKAPAAKTVATETVYTKVRGSDYQTYDLYKIQLVRPARTGFGVQVASLTQYENVMMQVAELQENWFNNILVSVERGSENKPIYKLILGPFPDRATAESYKTQLKKNKKIQGFVVDLSVKK